MNNIINEVIKMVVIIVIGYGAGYSGACLFHLLKKKRAKSPKIIIGDISGGKVYSLRQGEPPFSKVIWVEQHGVGSIGLTHQDAFKLIDLFFEKEFGKQSKAEDLNLGNNTLQ